jgi:hypothetical protein
MEPETEVDILLSPARHGKKHPHDRAKYIKAQLRKHGPFRIVKKPGIIHRPPKVRKVLEDRGVPQHYAPDDMADWLVVLMAEHHVCGRRLPRGKGFCLRPPTDERVYDQSHRYCARCWPHGGKEPTEKMRKAGKKQAERIKKQRETAATAKETVEAMERMKSVGTDSSKAAQNFRHGLYVDALLPGEEDIYDNVDITSVDEEIRMAKIRLRRLQNAQAAIEDALLETDKVKKRAKLETLMTVFSRTTEKEYAGGTVVGRKEKIVNEIPDYHNKINSLQAELSRMVKQRFEQLLASGAGELSPEERAERARKHLDRIMGMHTSED